MGSFEVRVNRLPRTRAAASASPAGRSHSENVWQRDREADPARGGSCTKGNFSTWLPPRRFAPPLLPQEGSRNVKQVPHPARRTRHGWKPCGRQVSLLVPINSFLDHYRCALFHGNWTSHIRHLTTWY